jgi:hypothetical protein
MLTARKVFRQAGSPANVASTLKEYVTISQKAIAVKKFKKAADFLQRASAFAEVLSCLDVSAPSTLPLAVGQRVWVRKGIKPHGEKAGTVTARSFGLYRVRLDAMGVDQNSYPGAYRRNELKKS